MHSDEKMALEGIAPLYHSEDLGGINEHFHLAVRDTLIPSEGSISALELGCGSGMWTRRLCQLYQRVDVVDASPELLTGVKKVCSSTPAELVCHEGLIEEFTPARGRTWEHIYLTFLIEHLIAPVGVLRNIRQWISPQGCIFLAVPNAHSLHRELAMRMGLLRSPTQLTENDKRLGHRRVYSMDLLSQHVEEAGYVIIDRYQIGLKPLSIGQMKHYSPALANALCGAGDLAGKHSAYIAVKATCRQ